MTLLRIAIPCDEGAVDTSVSAILHTLPEVSFKLRIVDLANHFPTVCTIMPPSVSYAALISQNDNVL